MFGGTDGYVRDVTAGVFATAYLPLLGATVAAMLAAHDGGKRVLIFIVLTICSDIGGYFAGITLTPFTGGHKMAPVISPKKTWEGLAGSALALRRGRRGHAADAAARPLVAGRHHRHRGRSPPPSSATWPSP